MEEAFFERSRKFNFFLKIILRKISPVTSTEKEPLSTNQKRNILYKFQINFKKQKFLPKCKKAGSSSFFFFF